MGDPATPPKDNYLLHRGGLASARLTGQHFIITERQGWILHPTIKQHLAGKIDIKIADLATGNGIWAVSLAKAFPEASITGLDISPQQFPAHFTWPSNVSFDVHNMFDAVPAKYANYFDVIHIRLIVAAIHDRDTSLLLSNLLAMLKPGGYLEWDEVAAPGPLVIDEDLNLDYGARSYIQRIYRMTTLKSAFDWIEHIPTALRDKGFVDVVSLNPPPKADLINYESESMVWSIQEILDTVRTLPKEGAQEEMEKASEELQTDVDDGTLYIYNWKVAIGRKPIEGC